MQNFNMVPVEKAQYGQFFNSDCYIIIYKYAFKNTIYNLIYYWLVRNYLDLITLFFLLKGK